MRGDEKVIAALNAALKEELTAINQYFIHTEMCENWGYKKLSGHFKKQSIDEMKHAEALIERILFLEGAPRMGETMSLNIGQRARWRCTTRRRNWRPKPAITEPGIFSSDS